MPYSAEISRANPGAFIFLIDQSGSMEKLLGDGSRKRKDVAVADVTNRIIHNLVVECSKGEDIRDWFYLTVLGYGARFGPAFAGSLTGVGQAPISQIARAPVRIESRKQKVDDGIGGVTEIAAQFPVWFDPVADGGTPMCQALDAAYTVCADWVSSHPGGFPPIVINITDGEATDGDPKGAASRIRSIAGQDGNVLLFNLHLSSQSSQTPQKIVFPSSPNSLPDDFARQLFDMSSDLPESMLTLARQMEFPAVPGSRGFVFNADLPSLVQFMRIGTRPTNIALNR